MFVILLLFNYLHVLCEQVFMPYTQFRITEIQNKYGYNTPFFDYQPARLIFLVRSIPVLLQS